MSRRYFGTDGIRGKVGSGVITAEFMLKLGWAAGQVFGQTGEPGSVAPKIIIGKDTRISGYMFESALEAGLVAAGANVLLLGPMPTPAIAYLTRTFQCAAGIVISASHNPYYDNGIKFFSSTGQKLPDDVEIAIEDMLDKEMTTVDSSEIGKVVRIDDAEGRYIEFCKSTVPAGFSLAGLKVVVDCAHGATYHVAPAVLRELGADVEVIGASPDGLNINEGVGSTKPEALKEAVLERGADIGVAFDGDGDRVLFVDEQGNILDGDALLYIIVRDQLRTKGECSGVVGTLMTNYGLELAFKELGVPFARAKVGDRYVNELMKQNDWLVGGESSGHIICSDVTSTGDGLVAALKVFFAVVSSGNKASELLDGLQMLPQVMINVARTKEVDINANPAIGKAVAKAEQSLGDAGRVLLRPSGTEPLVRVMVEGSDSNKIQQLAEELAEQVRLVLN